MPLKLDQPINYTVTTTAIKLVTVIENTKIGSLKLTHTELDNAGNDLDKPGVYELSTETYIAYNAIVSDARGCFLQAAANILNIDTQNLTYYGISITNKIFVTFTDTGEKYIAGKDFDQILQSASDAYGSNVYEFIKSALYFTLPNEGIVE